MGGRDEPERPAAGKEVDTEHAVNPPTASPGGTHVVWHQELICPGPACRGRRRVFPPGELIEQGRREQRMCPSCGQLVRVPAFYRCPERSSGPDHREPPER